MKLAYQLQSSGRDSDNQGMTKDPQPADKSLAARSSARNPFLPGSIVVVTLGNPRDKFWGMILALAPEGLSMSGIELAGFEDFVLMVKDGEPFSPAVVFFPMHRIERIELDLPDGTLPSLSQRFSSKTSLNPGVVLGSASVSSSSFRAPEEPA
ncbi:MAG: hypothetical protein ACLQLC_18450 [Candidatus Sulfotelmatobacter sp.]